MRPESACAVALIRTLAIDGVLQSFVEEECIDGGFAGEN